MSELQVYRDPKVGSPAYREFYEKSEVDKVLAEKDRDITILQESLQSAESVSSYRKRTIKEYEGKVDRMRTDISEKDTYISNLKNDIAEKDKEIQKWKAARDGCEQQFQAQVEETDKYLSQALELKYKRCVDKAKWCDERISRYTLQQEIQGISWQKEIKFYRRLKDKYIEISKRFNAGE